MAAQADVDGQKYCDLMEEVKLRVNVVSFFLSGQGHALYQPSTLESACLQVRKILELIAFGSLVANRDSYSSVYSRVSKTWNAGDLLHELEQVNPGFYPVPIIEVPSRIPGVQREHKKRDGDYLARSEFGEVYGRCGSIAHAANPYGRGIDYAYYQRMLPLWLARIVNLLNAHEIHLLGNPGVYVIHMSEHRDDRVHFYTFRPPLRQ